MPPRLSEAATAPIQMMPRQNAFSARRPRSAPARPHTFVRERFRECHQAEVNPTYLQWRSIRDDHGCFLAALGYRGAGDNRLFLEHYLARPIESEVSDRLGIAVDRALIVEIGCLASTSSWALLQLWQSAAAMLGEQYRVAVATVTEPVRRSLARLGLPTVELADANPGMLPESVEDWGSYYELRPTVCAGLIDVGVHALAASPLIGRAS